jgi:Spy/CpxP family protein refolding chaperone
MSHRFVPVVMALILTAGSAIGLPISANCMTLSQADMQMPRRAPGSRKQGNWLQELNLNREQLQKIQEIRRQYQSRVNQQRQAVKQAQQELKSLMASGDISSEQIRQKFNQVQTLRQRLSDTQMESMLAIRNILTAEQRQKLTEVMRQQRPSRRKSMNSYHVYAM